MLASELILAVSNDLQDQDSGDEYSRWTEDDLLGYLNDGERAIVFLKPQAYVDDTPFQLVAGVRQSWPSGAIEPIGRMRNMGPTGTTAGERVFLIEPKDMDECYPGWRSATASATVVHFMFDQNDRRSFEVYPPQPTSSMGYVEAPYSKVPPTIVKDGTSYAVSVNLGDEYKEALIAYMKFRTWAVDAQDSQYAYARSADAWQLFLALIGRKDLVESKLPAKGRAYGNSDQPI